MFFGYVQMALANLGRGLTTGWEEKRHLGSHRRSERFSFNLRFH